MQSNESAVLDQNLPLGKPAHAWYPLQTRYQCEKKVDAALSKMGWQTFTPMRREMRRWSDRMKLVEFPLFAGYTFVRMEAKPKMVLSVLQTPGLVRFVTQGREFAVVPDAEIESIRSVVQSDVPFESCPFPVVGEKVRIRGGCLDGVEGIFTALTGSGDLVVSVGAIQRSLRFALGSFSIEPIFERDVC
jgi:transcription antitermination factor NusG